MSLLEYFQQVSIIHLPDRVDRHRAMARELSHLGIDIRDPRVRIPFAPRPDDANGYTSRGVYGSFLSHYTILKDALEAGLPAAWVLEDDAIFRRRMASCQPQLVEVLQRTPWDMCFFGHTLSHELAGLPTGLVPYNGSFYWAHCYAVHARALPRVVAYLEETMANPPGHPRGGKVYIDAAYTLLRRLEPDFITLVANPVLSIQKGSISSLGGGYWYDRNPVSRPLINLARAARDEVWRRTGLDVTPGRHLSTPV